MNPRVRRPGGRTPAARTTRDLVRTVGAVRAINEGSALGRAVWLLPVGWVLLTLSNALVGTSFRTLTMVVVVGTALPSAFLARWRRADRPVVASPSAWVLVALACAGSALVTGMASQAPRAALVGWLVFAAGTLSALTAHDDFPRRLELSAVAWVLAAVAFAVVIAVQPQPLIDVFHFVSQAARAVASGQNPYAGIPTYPKALRTDQLLGSDEVWFHPYPYLPASALLLVPAQALLGDYRWCLLLALLLVVPLLRTMTSWLWALRAGFLVLAMPGWQHLAASGWIDPLLLVLALAAVAAAAAGSRLWAGLLAGLMVATKQYALIPFASLALWRPFGLRAAVWTLAVAATVTLPFLIGEPGSFLEGTVFAHASLAARPDAVTVSTVLASFGWAVPPALRLAVLGAVLAWLVRPARSAGEVFVLCGVAMSWSFLLSGHAFYNYYWLVAGFLGLGMACLAHPSDDRVSPTHVEVPSTRSGSATNGTAEV